MEPSGARNISPKRKPKTENPKPEKSQRERFIETARELGVDESGEKFNDALEKILGNPRSKQEER